MICQTTCFFWSIHWVICMIFCPYSHFDVLPQKKRWAQTEEVSSKLSSRVDISNPDLPKGAHSDQKRGPKGRTFRALSDAGAPIASGQPCKCCNMSIGRTSFLAYMYRWRAREDEKLRLLTSSDWATEARSRKSHSGGALQHWCQRQLVVALSCGEAEVHCGVCGLTWLIGVSNVLKEMRGECWGDPMEHAVGASTCKSILLRRGPDGIEHLDTKQLWVQGTITEKRIRVLKIKREENPADTLASHSSVKVM